MWLHAYAQNMWYKYLLTLENGQSSGMKNVVLSKASVIFTLKQKHPWKDFTGHFLVAKSF